MFTLHTSHSHVFIAWGSIGVMQLVRVVWWAICHGAQTRRDWRLSRRWTDGRDGAGRVFAC